MIIQSVLSPLGYIVISAMDGVEALGLLNCRDHLPDLVLLDVEMAGKSGFEVINSLLIHFFNRRTDVIFLSVSAQVCGQVRRDYPLGLPIIMMSGHTDETSILRGLKASLNCCLFASESSFGC